MTVPYWDGIGPRHMQLGVHELSLEARVHAPRVVWPQYRTAQEKSDCRLGRIRTGSCIV